LPILNRHITTLFFCCFACLLVAQNRVAKKRNTKRKIIGDTTKVYYNYITNPTERIRVDTSLYGFEDVDPTWNGSEWFESLGWLLGSPAYDLVFQPRLLGGFRIGLDQFSRYQLRREDVKYYQVTNNRPFTELYYSQINQKNNFVKADFGYAFNENVYIGLQYSLINQTGFYQHQRVRNQNIGFTLRGITNNKRYHAYFHFLTNAIKHEDNGGVTQDDIAGQTVDFLGTIGVASQTAEANYNLVEISYSHFLYNNAVDSTSRTTKATNEWNHRITYQFNRYKFFDTSPNADMYGDAYVNPRGIRLFIRHQKLENEIAFRQAIGGSLQSAPIWLKGYVRHTWNPVFQEPVRLSVHNFSAGLITQNNPQFKLKYRVEGQLTWAERQVDFFVKGRLGYDMGKFGLIEGNVLFERYQPSLLDRQLYVSWDQVWDNNLLFPQIQVLNFGGSYSVNPWKLRLRAEVLNHTLTNWVYYDSLGVKQNTGSINILQVKGQAAINIWKFNLDNEVIWQPTLVGKEFFRVPELLLKHNLYFESHLFKKSMLAKIGVLFYYNTPYYADAYTSLTGAFYLQNRLSVVMEPRLDAYVSFRIWQFRFFIRGENLLYFANERNYHTAYRRPIHNFVVRLGVSWRLFD